MKKLTEDLKRMLEGLAFQDAGDYLSMDEKLRRIAHPDQSGAPGDANAAAPHTSAIPGHVAVVINKGTMEAAFAHALQSCRRLGAHLALLLSGPSSRERMVQLEAEVKRAGVAFQTIYLSGAVASGIADYAGQQHSLIYMVAALDDPDIAEMVEEAPPARRKYLPVPLVLVGNKPEQRMAAAGAM
jgi:hypothetical protein